MYLVTAGTTTLLMAMKNSTWHFWFGAKHFWTTDVAFPSLSSDATENELCHREMGGLTVHHLGRKARDGLHGPIVFLYSVTSSQKVRNTLPNSPLEDAVDGIGGERAITSASIPGILLSSGRGSV